jgi:hypothetical protein
VLVDNIVNNKTTFVISKKHINEESTRKFTFLEKNSYKLDNQKFKDNKFRGLLESEFKKSTEKTYEDYERQEKQFKLEQLKRKAMIRVQDNRGQLFDKLLYFTLIDQPIRDSDINAFDGFEDIRYNTNRKIGRIERYYLFLN